MANVTLPTPQLPAYSLRPVPPLLPWLSDFHLSLVLPVAAYWLMSLIFWYISVRDLFRQYRIHTPAEFKQRNRVSAREVLRSVLIQQAVQTALGLLIGYLTSPGDSCGSEHYDIACLGWTSALCFPYCSLDVEASWYRRHCDLGEEPGAYFGGISAVAVSKLAFGAGCREWVCSVGDVGCEGYLLGGICETYDRVLC